MSLSPLTQLVPPLVSAAVVVVTSQRWQAIPSSYHSHQWLQGDNDLLNRLFHLCVVDIDDCEVVATMTTTTAFASLLTSAVRSPPLTPSAAPQCHFYGHRRLVRHPCTCLSRLLQWHFGYFSRLLCLERLFVQAWLRRVVWKLLVQTNVTKLTCPFYFLAAVFLFVKIK